jgi:hypothetical protein
MARPIYILLRHKHRHSFFVILNTLLVFMFIYFRQNLTITEKILRQTLHPRVLTIEQKLEPTLVAR